MANAMKNVFEEYNKKLIEIDEYISRHNEDYNLYNYKANILDIYRSIKIL
mgnify:CR=1 FL=1